MTFVLAFLKLSTTIIFVENNKMKLYIYYFKLLKNSNISCLFTYFN